MKYMVLLLVMCACSMPVASTMDVYISSEFTEEQTQDILQAASMWPSATKGDIEFVYHIGTVGAEVSKHQIFIDPAPESVVQSMCQQTTVSGCTHREILTDVSYIRIEQGQTENEMVQIAKHEIGHALGLAHDIDGTAMSPVQTQECWGISERDIAQFHSVRE